MVGDMTKKEDVAEVERRLRLREAWLITKGTWPKKKIHGGTK